MNSNKIREKYIYFGAAFTVFCLIGIIFLVSRLVSITEKNNQLIGKLIHYKDQIIYFDEVLTISARMGALTGEKSWEERYNEYVPLLDKSINDVLAESPAAFDGSNAKETQKANELLIQYEKEAFQAINLGDKKKAKKILFSPEYQKQKDIYSNSMKMFEKKIFAHVSLINNETNKYQNYIILTAIGLFLLTLFHWSLIFRKIQLLRKSLEKSKAEIEDRTNQLALMGEMSQGLIHDIANPISIIQLGIQAYESGISPEKQFSRIKDASQMATNIIKNIRSLSTNESNREKELCNLNEIVDDSILFSKKRLKANNINDIEKCFSSDVTILCKPSQLKQIMINLLINSSDAIKDHENRWIKISSFNLKGHHYITVTDSGSGIPDNIADHLFDPTFTTKERGEGTGLGLSLSKRLITSMGGKIEIDHQAKNTTFIISLPMELIKETKAA